MKTPTNPRCDRALKDALTRILNSAVEVMWFRENTKDHLALVTSLRNELDEKFTPEDIRAAGRRYMERL